jgi:hypothetical protein
MTVLTSCYGGGAQVVTIHPSQPTWLCSMARPRFWGQRRRGRPGLPMSLGYLFSWRCKIVIGQRNGCIGMGCAAAPLAPSAFSNLRPLTTFYLLVSSAVRSDSLSFASLDGSSSRQGWETCSQNGGFTGESKCPKREGRHSPPFARLLHNAFGFIETM